MRSTISLHPMIDIEVTPNYDDGRTMNIRAVRIYALPTDTPEAARRIRDCVVFWEDDIPEESATRIASHLRGATRVLAAHIRRKETTQR